MKYILLFVILASLWKIGNASELKANPVLPKEITLLMYDTDGCSHCVVMKKRLKELGIECPTSRAIEQSSYPVIVVYKDAKEIFRFSGLQTVEYLKTLFGIKP